MYNRSLRSLFFHCRNDFIALKCTRHRNSSVFEFLGPKMPLDRFSLCQTKQWNILKTFSDKEYGGVSSCSCTIMNDEDTEYLRFQGDIFFSEETKAKTKAVGGYCSFSSVFPHPIDISDNEGIEFILRSNSDRSLTVNLFSETDLQRDIYQFRLEVIRSEEWRTYYVPLRAFQIHVRGFPMNQIDETTSERIKGLGLLLSSTTSDQFHVDILSVTALLDLPSPRSLRFHQRTHSNDI